MIMTFSTTHLYLKVNRFYKYSIHMVVAEFIALMYNSV